ncbi:MAG: hypothetical protein IKB93_13105 [Clostridia bacterium]|nr:hypothetical protein [Clostridia bacterium]MBR2885705.1 hypothetical protein [Clostridia bacterium]
MIKRIYSDEVNKEFELDSENGIYVFCGYNSDKCLDEIVNAYKNDYFCLSTGNIKKGGLLLSESDLMIKNLEEFILRVEKSDIDAPVFIFGVFDRIDLGVDITPYLERLAKIKNQVFVSVCKNYPSERFSKFGTVFTL